MNSLLTRTLAAILLALSITCPTARAAGGELTLTVQAGKPGAPINPAMWGIFFEDINLGADGGLYAELVKNRSFEFTNSMMGWRRLGTGDTRVLTENPLNEVTPHYLRMRSEGNAGYGVFNEGFRGMGIREGESYDFSAQIRVAEGSPAINVQLVGADGKVLGSARLDGFSSQWKKYSATLTASATDPKAHMNVMIDGNGALDFDMVSLFPKKTWRDRPGGLRADMVQLLADMKPGFLRFPGGCIVEGSHLDRRYQWKTTIGPVEERKLIINRWNYEFRHKQTPDYFQSFGLGFFEFFQLAEDIGASPLPILNCGMACQFNTGQLVPLNQLDPYIQDALDLIEFANGPVTSFWGAKRAAMGHPAPFNMKMLGVGNEQWGKQYIDRYAMFAKAIREKYPEITLISDSGPAPSDDRFTYLWPQLRRLDADIVDEHCYARPIWFLNNADRYDNYDRKGPKVFMGEYAAQSVAIVSVNNRNNWECALSEAAFMTGLERNADVVRMASYAPLFGHIDGWQWTPNLIWADNLRAYGTPNYYVQKLFSRNRGDAVLPVKLDGLVEEPRKPSGGIVLSTIRTVAEFKDVRVTRNGETLYASDFANGTNGWAINGGRWSVTNGAFRQRDGRATAAATIGDATWTDYTLTLKAKKLSGEEGFVIGVRNESPGTLVQWNLGGWGNTKHAIQNLLGVQDSIVARVPGFIERERWHDIKIVVSGSRIKCYLNGQFIHSEDVPVPKLGGFFASAVHDSGPDEVIVKLANADAQRRDVTITLDGVKSVRLGTKMVVLTSIRPGEVNSFEEPTKVSPHESTIEISVPTFKQVVPAYAFIVLRIPVER